MDSFLLFMYFFLFVANSILILILFIYCQRDDDCWLDGLKNVIDSGNPVVVLQWYDGTRTGDDGGHYRLVVG